MKKEVLLLITFSIGTFWYLHHSSETLQKEVKSSDSKVVLNQSPSKLIKNQEANEKINIDLDFIQDESAEEEEELAPHDEEAQITKAKLNNQIDDNNRNEIEHCLNLKQDESFSWRKVQTLEDLVAQFKVKKKVLLAQLNRHPADEKEYQIKKYVLFLEDGTKLQTRYKDGNLIGLRSIKKNDFQLRCRSRPQEELDCTCRTAY